MSWLLFLDESGHDHRALPYEVRGGIALHAGQLWAFIQDLRRLELEAFGTELHLFKKEIKGMSLLDRDRFEWAQQHERMEDEARRKGCRGFLTKGLEKKSPTRDEFTAYGQACLEWTRGMFEALRAKSGIVFAAAVPQSVERPLTFAAAEYLRKDHVFLFERFFYYLEARQEHGLLVMDEFDKTADRRFVRRMENYFRKTQTGRYRTTWIVPTPFFVASDMAYPVQVADVCIYCINWGYRFAPGMDAPGRDEIITEFGPWLQELQFQGDAYKDGQVFRTFGIVCVPDPYETRSAHKKRR